MQSDITDFIGVFDNAFSKEYCDSLIRKFDVLSETNKALFSRVDTGTDPMQVDNNMYFPFQDDETFTFNKKIDWFIEFSSGLWRCYYEYARKYGILQNLKKHNLNPNLKIQKTIPSEGYHVWHCEHTSIETSNRLLLVMLYLNDIEQGGETEFLYQSRRVESKMGRLVICPCGYTHTHRGNPPLSGNKYMLNGWISYFHEVD